MKKKRLCLCLTGIVLAVLMAFSLVGCGEEKTYAASLSEDGANLTVGETLDLTFLPENFEAESVIWASSDTGVATVEGGSVKAVGAGNAVITGAAAAPDGKVYKGTCAVYVGSVQADAVYKVEYYKQLKDRSGYRLDEALTETKNSSAGASVKASAKELVGYVFDKDNESNVLKAEVKADGSTALKLYYDIKVIEVTFTSEVSIRDIVRTVDYGDELTDIPAVPEKPGYSGEWSVTSFPSVLAPITVTAEYTPLTYTVTIKAEGRTDSVIYARYGDKIDKPAGEDPVKADDEEYTYVFDDWYDKTTGQIWDFDSDTVTGDTVIEARFTASKLYIVSALLVGEKTEIGGKSFSLFEPTADDFAAATAMVGQEGDLSEVAISGDGRLSVKLPAGEYKIEISYGDFEIKQDVTVSDRSQSVTIELPQKLDLGGKMGDYASFNGGWEKLGYDSVKLSSHAYVFIGTSEADMTDRYYFEADVDFASVGKFVGLMAACDYKELSGDNGGNKLAFSYSGGNKIYKCNNNSWEKFETGGYISNLKADPKKCKFAILRDGSVYYLILNDIVAGTYVSDQYGESAFGFCNITPDAVCTFSNVRYTKLDSSIDALVEYFSAAPMLGGSFTRPDGSVVNSFSGGWTCADGASGTLSGPSYVFNGGTVGSIYYAEATFKKARNWAGIMINALDGVPSDNKGWFGYGIYDNSQLFLHQYTGTWNDGTPKGSVNTGSGDTYTLGVARINDSYYVFVNGVLALTEKVTAYSVAGDHTAALPADNASGFGLFIGSNFSESGGAKAEFTNFNYTMDIDEIVAKIGGSSVSYDTSLMTVKQFGRSVSPSGLVAQGVSAQIELNVPADKVVENLELRLNGRPVSIIAEDGGFSFTPVAGGSYEIEVSYAEKGEATVELSVKPYELTAGNTVYCLYPDLVVDPADVTVTITDMTLGTQQVSNLTALTQSFELGSGYYLIEIEYASNVYSYSVTLKKGDNIQMTGYVSPVYLGGKINIPDSSGANTDYYSYKNITVGNTSGNGWKLSGGQRDTVELTTHTFVYQNEVSGTKYYLEGVFDTTQSYEFSRGFGGLLVSHGPDTLNDQPSDVRFMAGIFGKSLVVCSILENWSPDDTRVLANLDELGLDYDPTSVRLGVVRDGTDYYFFVNGVFVVSYAYEEVTTECGIGLAAAPAVMTVSKFNYSLSADFIDALIASAPSEEKAIDVYFIAGQSNASGYSTFNFNSALAEDEKLVYGHNNVWYAGDAESTGANSAVVHRDLGWQLARIGQGAAYNKFGAEAGMAQALSGRYNAQSGLTAGIIKYAHGGTALLDNIGGENASNGNWVPPSYEAVISPKDPGNLTGGLYRGFLAQVEKNIAQLRKMGYTEINFKGLFWMQGESDKGNPSEYKRAFEYFASDIRRDLGKIADVDLSAMPIFIGEISRTSGSADSGTVATNERFIEMQRALPSTVSDTYVIASGQYDINRLVGGSNQAVGTDSWHWNQQDMLAIGRLVGASIIENVLS